MNYSDSYLLSQWLGCVLPHFKEIEYLINILAYIYLTFVVRLEVREKELNIIKLWQWRNKCMMRIMWPESCLTQANISYDTNDTIPLGE